MIDRNKLINWFEHLLNAAKGNYQDFVDLTVDGGDDILALLKEQEEVEPIPPTDESDLWKCGNCKHQLFRCTHQRYCEMCGKAVKWE